MAEEKRVLIIGLTGTGRSTLANIILGKEKFKTVAGLDSCMIETQTATVNVHDLNLKVIDTGENTEECMLAWKQMNPDVIILMLSCHRTRINQGLNVYEEIKRQWDDDSIFSQRLMLVFTTEGLVVNSMEEELEKLKPGDDLKNVLEKAQNRCVRCNDPANLSETEKKTQRTAIIDNIERVLGNKPGTLELKSQREVSTVRPEKCMVLLIGSTGSGKSSLGNFLLGPKTDVSGKTSEMFETGLQRPTTARVQYKMSTIQGIELTVNDTEDFIALEENLEKYRKMDNSTNEDERRLCIYSWKNVTSPKLDVVVLVIPCNKPCPEADNNILEKTMELWKDPDLFEKRLMVALTFSDSDQQETTVEDVKRMLNVPKERIVTVNNVQTDEGKKEEQRNNILSVMNKIMAEADAEAEAKARARAECGSWSLKNKCSVL